MKLTTSPYRKLRFTHEESIALHVRAMAGDQHAKNLLALSVISFAYMHAHRFARRRIDREEAESIALVGLTTGINKWDSKRGSLMECVKWWVKHEIFKYIHSSTGAVQVKSILAPTSPSYGHIIRGQRRSGSLSKPISYDGETTLGDLLIAREEDPADIAANRDEIEYLRKRYKWALRHIRRPRDRGILIRRHRGESLQEIGTRFSITRERVRQIQFRTEMEFRSLLMRLPPEK